MNPVTKMVNSYKTYRLEKKDLNRLRRIKLQWGEGEWEDFVMGHTLCVMQACAMVTTEHHVDAKAEYAKTKEWREGEDVWTDAGYVRLNKAGAAIEAPDTYGYTDHPICVSEVIADFLIELNDSCTDRERAKLKSLIPEIVNTCPIKVRQYKTKPDIEERGDTAEYRRAEAARAGILIDAEGGTFKEKLEAVRQAAAVYRTAPGLVDELL